MKELLKLEDNIEAQEINCLECQYLYRPNPGEDIYLCLKTLEKIIHEIDENILCFKFELISAYWKPAYINELKNFV